MISFVCALISLSAVFSLVYGCFREEYKLVGVGVVLLVVALIGGAISDQMQKQEKIQMYLLQSGK
ncbi:hypothetical protein PHYNN_177 [Pantoea phage Phynn]|nr:hypothetical protein PHYNN_177 [Pantoea phage Phynn]